MQMLLRKLLQLMSLNLFKMKFYLSKIMFKQILRHAELDDTMMALGYPYLIFGILIEQHKEIVIV